MISSPVRLSKRAGWLVAEKDRGVVDNSASDSDALLLAAGQHTGSMVQPVGKADAV